MKLCRTIVSVLAGVGCAAAASLAHTQTTQTFSATATVKTAGGATLTAPITVTVDRVMSQSEAAGLLAAFTARGVSGLRAALEGVQPTGSIRVGERGATVTRLTTERPTDEGRLITIVTDTPILFLGAGVPEAKAKDGYDFAVLDLLVDASGGGTGMLAPAARISVKQGVFTVDDYAAEPVRLSAVKTIR